MTIVVTGGGSGGHITPVLAVASQLKQLHPSVRIVYIGQRGDGLADIPAADPSIDEVRTVRAGKFRRYHGEGLRQLLDLKTVYLNIRDIFRVLAGLFEAYRILGTERPDAIFVKGGFVGVPVGLAAALQRIPFVTHDSDAIPGLANRIIGRWARYHVVALPKEVYAYPPHKTVTVGVPVSSQYAPVSAPRQREFKESIGVPADSRVLLVTGGGLGAQRLNDAILAIAHDLLAAVPDLTIVHVVGRANEEAVEAAYGQKLTEKEQGRVRLYGFTGELHRFSGAADLVVTRAGATAIAEFALQGRACIIVPNPVLTGGHQLKNAQALQEAKAVAVIDERSLQHDLPLVLSTITALLEDTNSRDALGKVLATFAHPDSAKELAELVLKVAGQKAVRS